MMRTEEYAISQLFTLRVWIENLGNDHSEIRGTLQHILTGETYHFREWERLSELVEAFVRAPEAGRRSKRPPGGEGSISEA